MSCYDTLSSLKPFYRWGFILRFFLFDLLSCSYTKSQFYYYQYFCLLILLLFYVLYCLPCFIYLLLQSEGWSKGDHTPQASLCLMARTQRRRRKEKKREGEGGTKSLLLISRNKSNKTEGSRDQRKKTPWRLGSSLSGFAYQQGFWGTHNIENCQETPPFSVSNQSSCRRPFWRSHCYSITLHF